MEPIRASLVKYELDGVQDREVTLTLTDFVGEYNDKPGACPMNADTIPVFSYDDEHWQILIFERGGTVYVLEGSQPHAMVFDVWFRVPRDRYVSEWARVIDEFNPIAPL